MVKDLELMLDISPLFNKKIVIWGIGKSGKEYLWKFIHLGKKSGEILLCDSDPEKCGRYYQNYRIMQPQELSNCIDASNYLIVISVLSLQAQDDILGMIDRLGLGDVDVYSDYGINWGMYLNRTDSRIPESYRQLNADHHEPQIDSVNLEVQRLKYFTILPLYNEMILVYVPSKVGSMSIHESILAAGKYALHVHQLNEIQYSPGNIKKLAQLHDTRILSVVRDPVARAISLLWYGLRGKCPYHPETENALETGFEKIQRSYFQEGFENREFEWFHEELKAVFGIDIYEYSFDKEKGYTIIEQDNIQIMLLTTESINHLESEIGDFLGINNFKIKSENKADRADYRFAYETYKRRLKLRQEMLDRVYFNNPYLKHFYTDERIREFYQTWSPQTKRDLKYDVELEV